MRELAIGDGGTSEGLSRFRLFLAIMKLEELLWATGSLFQKCIEG
jgi:hypothetical protein